VDAGRWITVHGRHVFIADKPDQGTSLTPSGEPYAIVDPQLRKDLYTETDEVAQASPAPGDRSSVEGILYDFTHGSYEGPRNVSTKLIRGKPILPTDTPAEDSQIQVISCVKALVNGVAQAPVYSSTIHRVIGFDREEVPAMVSVEKSLMSLKSGDGLNMPALMSFTRSERVARRMLRGEDEGLWSLRHDARHVVMKVVGGARVLHLGKFSTWDQKEVITQGKFKVLDIVDRLVSKGTAGHSWSVPYREITLEQTGVYSVQ